MPANRIGTFFVGVFRNDIHGIVLHLSSVLLSSSNMLSLKAVLARVARTSFELRSSHRVDRWPRATPLAGCSGVISPISRAWACTCLPEPVCVCLRKVPGAHFQLYEMLLNGRRSLIPPSGLSPAAPSSNATGVSSGPIQGPPIALSALTLAHPTHPCFSCFLYKRLPLQLPPQPVLSVYTRALSGEREMWPRRVLSGQ